MRLSAADSLSVLCSSMLLLIPARTGDYSQVCSETIWYSVLNRRDEDVLLM